MRAFVHTTDFDWYEHLAGLPDLDEINFWLPRPWGGQFRVLNRGEPLLFKLKRPHRAIAGVGFFEHYSDLPLSLAWDTFEEKNGVRSLAELRERIGRLRHKPVAPWVDDAIGCILLVEPVFWSENEWIPEPVDWKPNIVRGKQYDLTTGVGKELWDEVVLRLMARPRPVGPSGEPGVTGSGQTELPIRGGYGDPLSQRRRIGQGVFSSVIRDVYGRECAVTRERALPTLEAAHIRPFSNDPLHYVQNGILLRSDVHKLFDKGYITVTRDYHVEVSRRLRTDFDDGENYERMHGGLIQVPHRADHRPSPEILGWHNENKFRG